MLCAMREQTGADYSFKVLEYAQLKALVPEIGPRVAAATSACQHGLDVALLDEQAVPGGQIGGQSRTLRAAKILLATGAQEWPVPFPGWTLPGVMLLLIAWQLHKAGGPISAVLDTTPSANYFKALRHGVGALRGWRMLLKGLGYLLSLRKAGIKMRSGVTQLRAYADSSGRLAQVHFQHQGRTR